MYGYKMDGTKMTYSCAWCYLLAALAAGAVAVTIMLTVPHLWVVALLAASYSGWLHGHLDIRIVATPDEEETWPKK